jgi:hypothetical protein
MSLFTVICVRREKYDVSERKYLLKILQYFFKYLLEFYDFHDLRGSYMDGFL